MDWLTRFYQNRPQASGGRPGPEQPMLSPEMLARIDAELLQRAAAQQPGFHEQTMNVASERGYPGPQSAQFNRVIGESIVPNFVDVINRAFGGERVAQFIPGLTGRDVAERAGYEGLPAVGLGAAIDAGTPGGPLDRVMDIGKAASFIGTALAGVISPTILSRITDFGRLLDDLPATNRPAAIARHLTDNLDEIARRAAPESAGGAGGFTFDASRGMFVPRGTAAGSYPELSITIPVDQWNFHDLADYIDAAAPTLKLPGHTIGGWEEADDIYLDISTIWRNEEFGAEIGRQAGQMGVYTIDTGNFVPTGGPGYRDPPLDTAQLKDWARYLVDEWVNQHQGWSP